MKSILVLGDKVSNSTSMSLVRTELQVQSGAIANPENWLLYGLTPKNTTDLHAV